MRIPSFLKMMFLTIAGLTVTACSNYGYGGGVGYAGGYYDDVYGGPGWGGAGWGGRGWGGPGVGLGYGWYDNFYYPGNGTWVYDRGGRRHRWNDGQRRYWEGRRGGAFRPGGREWRRNPEVRRNYREFRRDTRPERREFRNDRREIRRDVRRGEITRPEARRQLRQERRQFRQSVRPERRELRRSNRQAIRRNR